jgi:Ni/Co efflux regulator RcnB
VFEGLKALLAGAFLFGSSGIQTLSSWHLRGTELREYSGATSGEYPNGELVKSIRWIYTLVFAAVIFISGTALAQGNGHAYGHDKHDQGDDDDRGNGHGKGHGRGHDRDDDREYARAYYHDEHHRAAEEWYSKHRDHLPPGLAKKGGMPPGLAKKLGRGYYIEPEYRRYVYAVPVDLEHRLPPPPRDCRHAIVAGRIVLMNRNTNMVVDIMNIGQ